MGKKYFCSIATFNVLVSPYLSSIFGKREVNKENNTIIYRPNEYQNSGTRAIVTPKIDIKGLQNAKLIDGVVIDLIHEDKYRNLEELLKK